MPGTSRNSCGWRLRLPHQALHLSLGQAGIEPDVKVGLQVGVVPLHAGQGRYGRDLPALEIQVVASEDVPEPQPALSRIVFYVASENQQNPAPGPFVVRTKRAGPSMARELFALPGLDI